ARDCLGDEISAVSRQGMVACCVGGLRRLVGLPAPHYMKIGVDSIEERIRAGAQETLSDPDLRSVLIELEAAETARNYRVTDALKRAGLYLAQRNASSQGDVVNGIFVRRTVPAATEPAAGRRQ